MYTERINFKTWIFLIITIQQIYCIQISTTLNSYSNVTTVDADYENLQNTYGDRQYRGTHIRRARSTSDDCTESKSVYSLKKDEQCSMTMFDSGVIPTTHDNIVVGNIGISTIFVEYLIGNKFWWFSTHPRSGYVSPGETKKFNDFNTHYVVGIRVQNMNKSRALYNVGSDSGAPVDFSKSLSTLFLNYDKNSVKLIMDLARSGSQSNMYKGYADLVKIVNNFLPKQAMEKPVLTMLAKLLPEKQRNGLRDNIQKYINPLENELKSIVKGGARCECIKQDLRDFLNMVFDLDKNLIYKSFNLSDIHALPIFSRIINFMVAIYTFAVTHKKTYDFTDSDIQILTDRKLKLYTFAKTYIEYQQKSYLRHVYEVANQKYIYDHMMNARTYIAVHGLEYLPFWKYVCDVNRAKLEYVTLAYSEMFGRTTEDLNSHTLRINNALQPPIVEDELNNLKRRKKVYAVVLHLGWDDRDTITYIRAVYENETYSSFKMSVFKLNTATIKKMQVGGYGALDYIIFTLSNNQERRYGKNFPDVKNRRYTKVPSKVFELKNHHIVGIHYQARCHETGSQVCNIAVSYMLDDINSIDFN